MTDSILNRYKVVVTTEYTIDAASESIAQHLFFDRDMNPGYRMFAAGAHKVSQRTKFTLVGDAE